MELEDGAAAGNDEADEWDREARGACGVFFAGKEHDRVYFYIDEPPNQPLFRLRVSLPEKLLLGEGDEPVRGAAQRAVAHLHGLRSRGGGRWHQLWHQACRLH